jgi:hypothetical protein
MSHCCCGTVMRSHDLALGNTVLLYSYTYPSSSSIGMAWLKEVAVHNTQHQNGPVAWLTAGECAAEAAIGKLTCFQGTRRIEV